MHSEMGDISHLSIKVRFSPVDRNPVSTAAAFSLKSTATATRAETLHGRGRAAAGVALMGLWYGATLVFFGVFLSATEHLLLIDGVSPRDFVPLAFALFALAT